MNKFIDLYYDIINIFFAILFIFIRIAIKEIVSATCTRIYQSKL